MCCGVHPGCVPRFSSPGDGVLVPTPERANLGFRGVVCVRSGRPAGAAVADRGP